MDNSIAGQGIRKRMLINTVSNYGKMFLGIFVTIFLTRILFLGLSRDEYGFWALLWSIFGYSLLLDFGFGTAVQKHTSECVVSKDWDKYNRVVSTVFFNYVVFALFIVLFALILSMHIDKLFEIPLDKLSYFRKVLVLFGIGSALCFPFGFFTEIMRGLQRMHARNVIQSIFIILNFLGMALMIKLKLNLSGMVFVALGTNLASSLTMMYVVHRLIPSFRLSFKFYDFSLLKSVMSFSLFAYLITFTNLIIHRTDQLVISIFGSVALVAIYQISIRLSDVYQRFSSQFLDNLGPVSATLFAAGHTGKMAQVMLQSNRLMGIISSLMMIPLVVYSKPLLKIWLDLDHTAGMICAIILLISMWVLLFFRSSSVYVLLMANEHKILAIIAAIEAIANLVLSILLIKLLPKLLAAWQIPDIAIVGVALGTFIPNLVLAFSFNIPKACRFASISAKEYFREVLSRTLLVTLIVFAFAFTLYHLFYPESLLMILAQVSITALMFLVFTWIIGLKNWEKQHIIEMIRKRQA